ncbi:MAG TPA: hypothetical protein DDX99_04965 [Desulfofustis sp.]|nr:hypothetical protein [Desulfofustis sp.]HBH31370.1 hypothetical protein [Desulfofustis sp.]
MPGKLTFRTYDPIVRRLVSL